MFQKLTLLSGCVLSALSGYGADTATIKDVPDYAWHAGCFGSASGNLMGYWDRNGFPHFYTGPTGGGVAPLDSNGANVGIHSLWASETGVDGRPLNQPGHIDDYWDVYEGGAIDPYVRAGRAEHEPDCLGDFTGASQNKWSDLDGECQGNLDAFAFNFWDKTGARRFNFDPPNLNGIPVRDLQSGFRKWTESRGYKAEVYSQLADFTAEAPAGTGFTVEDLKAEIDAGYPVLLFLQQAGQFSRSVGGMPRGNPEVHGMIAHGYTTQNGVLYVHYRTSWAYGDFYGFATWSPTPFEVDLSLRGVIAFHPMPKIQEVAKTPEGLRIRWDGPSSTVAMDGVDVPVHWYVIEHADTVDGTYTAISDASTNREAIVAQNVNGNGFFRVKLLDRSEIPQ